jgi:hypothetical protein
MMRASLRTMRRISWGAGVETFGWESRLGESVGGWLKVVWGLLIEGDAPLPGAFQSPSHLDDGVDVLDVLHPHAEVLVEPPLPGCCNEGGLRLDEVWLGRTRLDGTE